MTEIMIDTAEEEFLKGRTASAFKWATIAKELDPFFQSVNQYVEGYRIHMAALKRHRSGEIDWYNVLGVKEAKYYVSISSASITHQFVKIAKLINPDVHCSAAAPKAFKLVTTAWETLGDPDKRRAYHTRVGLPPPISEKPLYHGAKFDEPPKKRPCLRSESDPPKSEKRIQNQKRCGLKLGSHHRHRTATRTFIV